ncbi:MAG: rhomboid family intramembrane serine protease, partial [Planctomycetaceae bacterium]|nr:rhomboid family intramembrane serine protease [Planctomycetaceae bacterium]
TMSATAAEATGVAWWAHIGGFAVGVVAAWLLGKVHLLRPRNKAVRPNTQRMQMHRFHRGQHDW